MIDISFLLFSATSLPKEDVVGYCWNHMPNTSNWRLRRINQEEKRCESRSSYECCKINNKYFINDGVDLDL